MNIKHVLIFLFISIPNLLTSQYGNKEESISSEKEKIYTIAFGSCNNEYKEQILWDDINALNPNIWIWLGDNIYGDTEDMGLMREKYKLQKSNPGYQELIKNSKVYGIWDDHDYGANNSGKDFPKKDESRDLMFDFLEVPMDNPARKRKGAYQSYLIEIDDIKLKLILLDSRYFRDDPIKDGKGYKANLKGTILGKAQWEWLEKELKNSLADVNIIANGIQVIPEEHQFEKWANFPKERDRLLDLIVKNKVSRPLLLSGDRHLSELSKIELKNYPDPIYDITSSGMTHSYSSYIWEPNRHRVGEVIKDKSFAVLEVKRGGMEEVKLELSFRGDNNKIFSSYELY